IRSANHGDRGHRCRRFPVLPSGHSVALASPRQEIHKKGKRKRCGTPFELPISLERKGGLCLGLRLAQADRTVAWLELATLLQQFDAFEPLEDVSLGGDGATAFETAMLGHGR